MTWNGIDLTQILALLATVVTGLLGWLANSIKKKQEASAAQSKAETALLKLAAIAAGMAGRAWSNLSPVVQKAMADGKLDAPERAEIEAKVQELLKDFASADDLKLIADALGIPLPGLVAKIAAMLIEKFAFAHDPTTPNQSRLAFPVTNDLNGPDYQPG